MDKADLNKCLLSTVPFISLRTLDNESIIRLVYSPQRKKVDLIVLAAVDGVLCIFGALVSKEVSKTISHKELLGILQSRIAEETTSKWEIVSYGDDIDLSTRLAMDGVTQLTTGYIGLLELCTFTSASGIVDFEPHEFSLSILGNTNASFREDVLRLVRDAAESNPYLTEPTQRLIDECMRIHNSLSAHSLSAFRTIVASKSSLPTDVYCRQNPEAAYKELAQINARSSDIKVIHLRESETWRDHESKNKIFSTESSGTEMRTRSGLEAATKIYHHTIFLVLPDEAIFVSPSYIDGLLRNSIVHEGTLEAFWNRYKFVGWDKFKSVLRNTVEQLYRDNVNKRIIR